MIRGSTLSSLLDLLHGAIALSTRPLHIVPRLLRAQAILLIRLILHKRRVLHAGLSQPALLLQAGPVLPARQGGRDVDLEAKDARHVAGSALLRDQGRVDLEEDVVEGGAEVGAVDGGVARRFRVVDVLALGAVHLHRPLVWDVGLAHG